MFGVFKKMHTFASHLRENAAFIGAFSSAGSEHLPYKLEYKFSNKINIKQLQVFVVAFLLGFTCGLTIDLNQD
ncbi:hypothetical protein FACS1894179_02940 [Bacteroidia bacterium]|nr:hypothetical protein FACS1894179_02940 [Bacteroidia bacterium]